MDETQLPNILQILKSAFTGGSPNQTTNPSAGSSTNYPASQPTQYPTSDDVAFARVNDYSYGQPWAPEFEGKSARLLSGSPNQVPMQTALLGADKPVDSLAPQAAPLKDLYAKAALASEGSALAKLGFDPNKMAVDVGHDPRQMNIEGMYNPKSDQIYANAQLPDVMVHESIHRGIEKLKNSPFWQKEFDPIVDNSLKNEMIVRHLMATKMGDPEAANDSWAPVSKDQRNDANYLFNKSPYAGERSKILSQMEDAAANYIAQKRPGGPR